MTDILQRKADNPPVTGTSRSLDPSWSITDHGLLFRIISILSESFMTESSVLSFPARQLSSVRAISVLSVRTSQYSWHSFLTKLRFHTYLSSLKYGVISTVISTTSLMKPFTRNIFIFNKIKQIFLILFF